MPASRSVDASRWAIELDGALAGYPDTVSGGEAFADVVEEPPVGTTVDKHLGPRRYEPIVVEAGTSMGEAWSDAIRDMVEGKGKSLSGAIVMMDANLVVVSRLEWKTGVITEVAFPKADLSSKSVGRLRVVIQPDSTAVTSGGGGLAGKTIGGKQQKQLLQSNYRFQVTGLESACTRISQVSAITVRRADSGVITVDDVELQLSAADAAPFGAWFDGLIDERDSERAGFLAFLDPSLKRDLLRIELRGLGACRVARERLESGAERLVRSRVRMYCEGATLTRTAKDEAAAKPSPAESDAGGRRSVERLAAALLDAAGATSREPLSREAIATRLLDGATAPRSEEASRERGLAAGRAWAGDEARLDELQDLAAVAERDEWSAIALDESHTLRSFLTSRGDLPADESATDLGRDEFTTGLLAGIAEVHRGVAPLLEDQRPRRG